MTKMDYLKLLVDEIHSTTVATIGSDGHPQTRIIDMMYYDEEGVYFLTAKGKAFYDQLMEQQYVAISATKEKIAVSLRGRIKNIGKKNLDIMFERNPYMKKIYPGDTKDAIEVFQLYEAQGEYFDISNPSNIVRNTITIGKAEAVQTGYFVGKDCMDCQHFFRQIFLGYFSDIVQAFDTLRKNVCGDDYTSLHNPIVLSSVLPAYGMFHSIQILFL